MSTAQAHIQAHLKTLAKGTVFELSEIPVEGSMAEIAKAFVALLRSGQIIRLRQQWYTAATESRLFGWCPPGWPELVGSISDKTGHVIVPTGASAANALRLSTQVPVRQVYWTSAPNMSLHIRKSMCELIHQPEAWLLQAGSAGMGLRALHWMGPDVGLRSARSLDRVLPSGWRAHALDAPDIPQWLVSILQSDPSRLA